MINVLNKIINYFKKLKSNRFLNKFFDQEFYIATLYAFFYDTKKINQKVILYESSYGENITGDPYAIYKCLITNPVYKDFKHVWAVDSFNNRSINLVKNNPSTKVVRIGSATYLKFLTTAKYLINDKGFGPYFHKKDGQIYINTWNGIYSNHCASANVTEKKNLQKNFLHVDYLVSPNKKIGEKILTSLNVDGIYNGYILTSDYPKRDLILNSNVEYIKNTLNIPKDKKVILYALLRKEPLANDALETLIRELDILSRNLSDECIVLVHAHSDMYKRIKENGKEYLCVSSSLFDVYEILSVVDILITDYSNNITDYLITRKPIFLYEPIGSDLNVDLEKLPGPICSNMNELIENIKNVKLKDRTFKQNTVYGYATDKLIKTIFENEIGNKDKDVYKYHNNKKKILMYAGSFYNNGITVAILNLAKYFDYGKYDLTIICNESKNKDCLKNINSLSNHTRVIYRIGKNNMRINEFIRHQLVKRKGFYANWAKKIAPINAYKKELKRMIGDTQFDVVVDFGGYDPFWTTLFAFSDISKKVIFLHSDMLNEYHKKVDGVYKHRKNLKLIFSLYNYFDKIISVTKSANEINKQNFQHLVSNHDKKMDYVNNIIDYQKILEHVQNKKIVDENRENGKLIAKSFVTPNKQSIDFVNMGRLSPEKDQEKLIRAFSKVVKMNPTIPMKLYIIGEGPLESDLKKLTYNLGLDKNVIFTGYLSNPYSLINECDCLVVSSNYEGQGLVILEGLVLGKPIIATDVTGVNSVLKEDLGLLVKNSVEGLASGMNKFIHSGIEVKRFDYIKYNEEALKMYYQKVF